MDQLNTKDLLTTAIQLVGGDRHKDYGDKVKNHDNIAKLWSAYKDVEITGAKKLWNKVRIARAISNLYIELTA